MIECILYKLGLLDRFYIKNDDTYVYTPSNLTAIPGWRRTVIHMYYKYMRGIDTYPGSM